MDEARRAVLAAELDEAVRERERLDTVIEYLSSRLGVGPPATPEGDGGGGGGVDVPPISPDADPAAVVREGEFFGLSGPKATKVLMEKFGRERPLKTEEIFHAITKGGVKVQSQQGLYRSLFRDPKFTKVGTSLWGLSAWYPAGARKAAKADAEAEAHSLGLTDEQATDDEEDDETTRVALSNGAVSSDAPGSSVGEVA